MWLSFFMVLLIKDTQTGNPAPTPGGNTSLVFCQYPPPKKIPWYWRNFYSWSDRKAPENFLCRSATHAHMHFFFYFLIFYRHTSVYLGTFIIWSSGIDRLFFLFDGKISVISDKGKSCCSVNGFACKQTTAGRFTHWNVHVTWWNACMSDRECVQVQKSTNCIKNMGQSTFLPNIKTILFTSFRVFVIGWQGAFRTLSNKSRKMTCCVRK